MNDKTTVNYGGINFLGLLTIVFVTLKLTHVIDWSWWWVLSPLWGPMALALFLILIIGLIASDTVSNKKDRR